MAMRLHNLGIKRIRPLAGGLAGWRERGFPLQLHNLPAPEKARVI